MALVVGLHYRKRALPICWLVYKGKKGHTTAQRHIQLLESLRQIVGLDRELNLLGDGEFDSTKLLFWLQEQTTWKFAIRTGKNMLVSFGEKSVRYDQLAVCPGYRVVFKDIVFTNNNVRSVNAVVCWDKAYKEPIYLVTNIPDLDASCDDVSQTLPNRNLLR